MAGKILVPQVGTEPMAPALEAWSLNYWTTRQVTGQYFLYIILIIPLMIFFFKLVSYFLSGYSRAYLWTVYCLHVPSR